MHESLSRIFLPAGFQKKALRERLTVRILFGAGFLLIIYTTTALSTPVPASHDKPATAAQQKATSRHLSSGVQMAAPATITTPLYEVKVYWAIPYLPVSADDLLVQATPGYRFVVLDMSFRNTTTDQEVDMGLVSLTAVVQDEKGRQYFSDALVIASFQQEYSFPQHQLQYGRMRGILKPGEVYRATVFAFEAPVEERNFTLIMEGGSGKKHLLYQTTFSIR